MNKRTLALLLALTLLAGSAAVALRTPAVAAQDPTIPTRTPRPDPNQPNPPPGGGGGDNENDNNDNDNDNDDNDNNNNDNSQPPQASETPVGGQTIGTPAASGTAAGPTGALPGGPGVTGAGASTPAGVVVPSAAELACGDIPYIMALSRIAVHDGPGIDYSPLTTLERDELRPIIGRATYAPWWQIQIAVDQIGWVMDAEVTVLGSTVNVPVVADPLLNGVQPTAGAPWNPTPQVATTCDPTPTPTATPTSTAEAGGDQSEAAAAAAVGSTSEPGSTPPAGEVTVDESVAVSADQTNVQLEGRGATASRAGGTVSDNLGLIIPLAGLALIAAGIVLVLVTRGRGRPAVEGQDTDA